MNWSDLQPGARAAIVAVAFVAAALLVWSLFVSPMRARRQTVRNDISTAETQLESMEREIESIPPATASEGAEWQSSRDELLSRLGPESELPLLIESLIRLADAQEIELFLSSESASPVASPQQGQLTRAQRVVASVPGASYVPLNARIFGDYAATSRFISQIGRLGWVTEIDRLAMQRNFPEVVTELRLIVFFRPTEREGGNGASGPGSTASPAGARLGAQGGGNG